MPVHKSAKRQWRYSLRRRDVNRSNKSILRNQIKDLREAINNQDKEEAQRLLPITISTIDKTVKKGTIHKNQGNRFKSRLSRQVVSLDASPSK